MKGVIKVKNNQLICDFFEILTIQSEYINEECSLKPYRSLSKDKQDFKISQFRPKCARSFNSVAKTVFLSPANMSDDVTSTDRAQADYARGICRRHDCGLPKTYEEFLRQLTQDSTLIEQLSRATPQAIGNDLLSILVSSFGLQPDHKVTSTYDEKVSFSSPIPHYIPTSNFPQLLYTKGGNNSVVFLGSLLTFAMMKMGDEPSLFAYEFDHKSQDFKWVDIIDRKEELDQFYEDFRNHFSGLGNRFFTFEEMVAYCRSCPKDKPCFLPVASSLIDCQHRQDGSFSVWDLMAFHPNSNALSGFDPIIASSDASNDDKNAVREALLFNRLGEKTLPKDIKLVSSHQSNRLRDLSPCPVETTSAQYDDYASFENRIFADHVKRHECETSYLERFARSLYNGLIAEALKNRP